MTRSNRLASAFAARVDHSVPIVAVSDSIGTIHHIDLLETLFTVTPEFLDSPEGPIVDHGLVAANQELLVQGQQTLLYQNALASEIKCVCLSDKALPRIRCRLLITVHPVATSSRLSSQL